MSGSDTGGSNGAPTGGSSGTSVLALAVLVALAVALLVGGLIAVGSGPLAGSQPNESATPAENGGSTPDGTTSDDGSGANDSSSGTGSEPTTPEPWADAEPLAGTRSLADARTTIAGTGGDELGFAAAVGDLNGDGRPDLVLGSPLHDASGPRSGAVAVFFGPVERGHATVDDADVWLPGADARDWAGNSVAVADVNDDGVDDLVVGAPRNDAGGENAGAVHVVYGGADLGGEVPLGSADAAIVGGDEGAWVGYSVAAANLTGGPGADVVAGAPRTGDARGAVHVVDGDRTADGGPASTADADATFRGESPDDEAGWSVAVAGDVTGGGSTDVAVGARRNDDAGGDAGAVYVVEAPFGGERSLADAALVRRGPGAGAMAGWSVAGPGDVDGDGTADLLVGAPLDGPGGAAYLVTGDEREASLADAHPVPAEAGGDRAGWVVAGPGDVTCNGTPDLLVGAPEHDAAGEQAGAVYLVAGEAAAAASAENPVPLDNATATLTGPEPGDQAGRATSLGAVRGENGTRLVVGAAFGEPPVTAHLVDAGCPAG
jgi:hypothetical protein